MAEKKTCPGCGKTYWSPGADWQHKDCALVVDGKPVVEIPVKAPRKPKIEKAVKKRSQKPVKIEVPAGFVCPVCEARRAVDRARVERFRKRKAGVS